MPHRITVPCRIASAILIGLALLLAACGPGNQGGTELAFLRGGALYTIQPNGGVLLQVAPAEIVGFAWSPDHHQFVARFAAVRPTPQPTNPLIAGEPDMLAGLGIISIDGGNIIPIIPAAANTLRSDAWWDGDGNRLLYREQLTGGTTPTIQWILSQADQPNGIARKLVASGPTIPATAPDGSQIVTVMASGDLVVGPPQAAAHVVQHNALLQLPGGAWPARPLWQPGHRAILYAAAGPDSTGVASTTLMLTDLAGHSQTITTVAGLEQYSWSPDGSRLLLRTAGNYTIHALDGKPDVAWMDGDSTSLPWWSPDGKWILTRSTTALTLVNVASGTVQTLARFTGTGSTPTLGTPVFHPVTGNPWQDDSRHFAFVAGGGRWMGGSQAGTPLATKSQGTGLFVVALSNMAATPKAVDWGEHAALSWSTPDPNTQFLTQ